MGRPISRDFEGELVLKFKALFDKIVDGVNKENPSYPFDFERFVDSFNTDDYITKQVFEFLVKEAAHSYRRANPYDRIPPFPRPPTMHHTASSFAPGAGGSSSPFTSLSSSLSSLAFDNGQHHDRGHSDGSQSEDEHVPGRESASGVGTGTGLSTGTSASTSTGITTAVRGSQRSLTPNSTAASGSTSRTSRSRPWSDQDTNGRDLGILTQMFNRSRERRSRERTRTSLGSGQPILLENDNSDDSDTSDDSLYESITHSRSIMGTMHDLDPSPSHSPGRNTAQSSASRQNNSVSFAQLYPPLSASPSSPNTFASSASPSSHSAFPPSSQWDSSAASRADRLQRMSRYIFDDSGMARLRQPGYINSFRYNWRQQHRRLERYRASASLLDNLSGGGPSSSSSTSAAQPWAMPTIASPISRAGQSSSITASTSADTDATTSSGRRGLASAGSLTTTRPEAVLLSGYGAVQEARDFIAQTEDRYNSFAEATRRGRSALRSAVMALEETLDSARSIRNRHGSEDSTATRVESSSSSGSNTTERPTSSTSTTSVSAQAPAPTRRRNSEPSISTPLRNVFDNDYECDPDDINPFVGASDETVAGLSVLAEGGTRPPTPVPRADSPYPNAAGDGEV
ncbi:hypothetical protein BGZ95_002526 [Linnemannia exigua]|uniref:Uncharacterized protein n=1 Tax=Linnemannia exigua TaxID=604196 RepID=A0AAD4D5U0_9FUNG|nr:hypothetical protein BGZ95_002526 [Linnemannia exigua]